MGIDRLPAALRLAAYAAAVAVLLYLTLAPSHDLPQVNVWDKAEHATAWLVLAGLGLILFPRRPVAIAAFSLGMGALVEVLQGVLPFGRDADIHDFLGDTVGVAAALAAYALIRRWRRA